MRVALQGVSSVHDEFVAVDVPRSLAANQVLIANHAASVDSQLIEPKTLDCGWPATPPTA
jgi:hypothetical protein